MPLIDPTFLTLHQGTALWWEQRLACETCKHRVVIAHGNENTGGWRCRAVPGQYFGVQQYEYCINVRLEDGACGLGGKLFDPI